MVGRERVAVVGDARPHGDTPQDHLTAVADADVPRRRAGDPGEQPHAGVAELDDHDRVRRGEPGHRGVDGRRRVDGRVRGSSVSSASPSAPQPRQRSRGGSAKRAAMRHTARPRAAPWPRTPRSYAGNEIRISGPGVMRCPRQVLRGRSTRVTVMAPLLTSTAVIDACSNARSRPIGARLGQRREREHRGTRAGGEHAGRVAFAERGSIFGGEPDRSRGLPADAGVGERRAHTAFTYQARIFVVVDHAVAPRARTGRLRSTAPPGRVRRRHAGRRARPRRHSAAPASAPTTKVPGSAATQRVEHRRSPTDLFDHGRRGGKAQAGDERGAVAALEQRQLARHEHHVVAHRHLHRSTRRDRLGPPSSPRPRRRRRYAPLHSPTEAGRYRSRRCSSGGAERRIGVLQRAAQDLARCRPRDGVDEHHVLPRACTRRAAPPRTRAGRRQWRRRAR